ncbi:ABC transporter permease [Streptosporangium sp. NPDC051023]|uniref:ABC transporter permease n=1 Tax=Streptosporangium sp. NPDC051023 TaxID=3155410 RepID=UPI00344C3404
MRPHNSVQHPAAQLADLILVQLSNWRWAWPQLVLTGLVAPLASMLALSTVSGGANRSLNEHILVGMLMFALLFQNQNQVAGNFSFMKANGTLEFFAAQPVSRVLLAIATVGAFFLLSLPALLVIVVVGALVLGVGLSLSPWLLVVVPLCVVSAAGIGALIGSLTNTMEESGAASLVVTFLMTGCGPVLIPADRLPAAINAIGVLNPATYAASALRASLTGTVGSRLPVDLAVLALFAAGVLLLLVKRMPWRMRR